VEGNHHLPEDGVSMENGTRTLVNNQGSLKLGHEFEPIARIKGKYPCLQAFFTLLTAGRDALIFL
jgi:hypothetical protein